MSTLDRLMPPVQYADVNGIRMAYYEVGPRGQGTPIVFCHGFPELAFSWREQLKACEAAGIWAIAPDQRGYGLTSRPETVTDYDMEHLCGDLVGLLDHVGAKKAVFCGHDWGGIIVWRMPILHLDRVAGVIGLNTPYMPRPPVDPIAIMRARMGEDMYIVAFQRYGEADAVLNANARKAMDFFMRRPLDGPPAEMAGLSAQKEDGGESPFALIKMVQAYDPAVDPRPFFLSDDEFEAFAETFERTGFTGGINWYRNFTRNWEASEGVPDLVSVPSLMIMAEKDAVLPPSAADGMEAYVPDLEKILVRDSGHWTQQEQPQAVNEAILGWMGRRFPR
jgi:pimeloyl-ACP methyl ester carboxylesterase